MVKDTLMEETMKDIDKEIEECEKRCWCKNFKEVKTLCVHCQIKQALQELKKENE